MIHNTLEPEFGWPATILMATKEIWRARKENTNKESQTGENKAY